jgi:hypothetical protein
MNTSEITSFIKKYYLDGQCESAIWNQTLTGYNVNFYTTTKDCLGEISIITDTQDSTTTFGVYNTSQLLSLMNITDEYCNISIQKDIKENPIKLQISDNQFETFYHLADLNLFDNVPKIEEPEQYDINITLDMDFTSRFIKAKNALDKSVNRVLIETKLNNDNEKCVEFTIGENSQHANKIKFNTISEYESGIEPMPFNADIFKVIFQSNKDFDSGSMQIYKDGLVKIEFIKKNISSKYYLVRLSTS